jgi:hypothetical protein
MQLPNKRCISLDDQISFEIPEPKSLVIERQDIMNTKSLWETFSMR